MNIIKVFKKYCKKYVLRLVLIFIMMIFLNYIRSLIPLLYGKVFDILDYDGSSGNISTLPSFISDMFIDKSAMDSFLLIFILILAICGVRELINIVQDMLVESTSEDIGFQIQTNFFNHIQLLPYSYLNRVETGDLIQRATSDVNKIKRLFEITLPELVQNIIKIIIYTLQIYFIDYRIGIIVSIFLPIMFIFVSLFCIRMDPIYTDFENNEGKYSTCVQENLSGIRVVKAFGKEKQEIDKQRKQIGTFMKIWNNMMSKNTTYWSCNEFMSNALLAITFIVGIFLLKSNKISDVGKIVSIIFYIEYIMWPARQIGREVTVTYRTDTAAKRIVEIINMKTEFEESNGSLKPVLKGNVTFKNVSYSYPSKTIQTLNNISFNIKAGQTVAIIGTTGSGKSTLISLLNRMIEPTDGQIYLDEYNLKDLDKECIRKQIGIVLQEPFLYSRSIKENIAITDDSLTFDRIKKAADIANIIHDIENFKDGFDTFVGEKGVTLSGGQKQRIGIARTLVSNKPILVFDDSLSAVDTDTDKKIRKALKDNLNNSTKFIITHRISTAKDADVIIVLDNGKISNIGTHGELIKQEGLYKNIYCIQNYFEGGSTNE